MSIVSFQSALQRLVEDKEYRTAVSKNGNLIQSDFNLTDAQMKTMKDVGIQSGWVKSSDNLALDNVSCCCCCCPI